MRLTYCELRAKLNNKHVKVAYKVIDNPVKQLKATPFKDVGKTQDRVFHSIHSYLCDVNIDVLVKTCCPIICPMLRLSS